MLYVILIPACYLLFEVIRPPKVLDIQRVKINGEQHVCVYLSKMWGLFKYRRYPRYNTILRLYDGNYSEKPTASSLDNYTYKNLISYHFPDSSVEVVESYQKKQIQNSDVSPEIKKLVQLEIEGKHEESQILLKQLLKD